MLTADIEEIREFVIENFLFGSSEGLENETSFLASRIVDSTGMLELITFLEERFGISIDDEELVPENMDSLKRIARFLSPRLEANRSLTTAV